MRAPWRVVTAGRLLVLGLLLLVAAGALWAIPSREYIFLPDRAHPVAPLVRVAGGHEPADTGGIYFVDVIVRKASLLERLFGGLRDGATLHPVSEVVPQGLNEGKERELERSEMRLSQQNAAAVAMRTLGPNLPQRAAGARVYAVEKGLPADRHLRPSDVIVAVDGAAVRSPEDVSRLMRGKPVGTRVVFTVHRAGATRTVELRTVAAGQGPARGIVGILLDQAGVLF